MRAFLVVTLAVLVYAPALSPDVAFVYEDRAWRQAFQEAPAMILAPRVLTAWTWYLQREASAAKLHAVNLGLHLVVAGLVWGWARRLGLSAAGAGFAGAVFALHRVPVEAVAYAAGRAELIAAAGVMGACLVTAAVPVPWWRWLVAGACLGLGVLGKESAIVAIALVPLSVGYAGTLWRRFTPCG